MVLLSVVSLAQAGTEDCPPDNCAFVPLAVLVNNKPTATSTNTPTVTVTPTITPTATNTSTPTITPTPAPREGNWSGLTNSFQPVSFSVISGGTQWQSFKISVQGSGGNCSGFTLTLTFEGPSSITNNQFAFTDQTGKIVITG
jgi:hypothetical protein